MVKYKSNSIVIISSKVTCCHHVAEKFSLCNKQQSLSHFQTLLRYGANPELRDEDGKTPLDKARERGDEGHREVIQILQSPGGYLTCIP